MLLDVCVLEIKILNFKNYNRRLNQNNSKAQQTPALMYK